MNEKWRKHAEFYSTDIRTHSFAPIPDHTFFGQVPDFFAREVHKNDTQGLSNNAI